MSASTPSAHSLRSKYLNLGCGERFHSGWVNLDLHPANPSVKRWDVQKALPFSDGSFDVVYHSHVLEHLSKRDAPALLSECRRVLKSGGVIRVVVPDLERIAQLYFESLRQSLSGNIEGQSRYDWAMLEMFDQTVRESSGGEMAPFVQKAAASLKPLLRERLGGELDGILCMPTPSILASAPAPFGHRLRRKLLRLLIGPDGVSAYDYGRFRRSGEIHQWMYDRYSLAKLLESAGFNSPRSMGPAESVIPGWVAFNLDTEPDGSVYKPDSLFMEAIRT
jgi:predicted SAM-dependent methyltransferase